MSKNNFNYIIGILSLSIFFASCKKNPEDEFLRESKILQEELKKQSQDFLENNHDKLTDEALHIAIDSIAKTFLLDKNKELALRYIETQKGVEQINYLKKHIDKEELKLIIEKIPSIFSKDTNFISLKKYLDQK